MLASLPTSSSCWWVPRRWSSLQTTNGLLEWCRNDRPSLAPIHQLDFVSANCYIFILLFKFLWTEQFELNNVQQFLDSFAHCSGFSRKVQDWRVRRVKAWSLNYGSSLQLNSTRGILGQIGTPEAVQRQVYSVQICLNSKSLNLKSDSVLLPNFANV